MTNCPDERSKRGKRNRRKGHDHERDLVKAARAEGYRSQRNLQYRGAAQDGCDVEVDIGLGRVIEIEAKCRTKLPSSEVVDLLDTADVIAVKVPRRGEFYAMSPETFWRLLRAQPVQTALPPPD